MWTHGLLDFWNGSFCPLARFCRLMRRQRGGPQTATFASSSSFRLKSKKSRDFPSSSASKSKGTKLQSHSTDSIPDLNQSPRHLHMSLTPTHVYIHMHMQAESVTSVYIHTYKYICYMHMDVFLRLDLLGGSLPSCVVCIDLSAEDGRPPRERQTQRCTCEKKRDVQQIQILW
ncbi:hypothetical protein TGRUB_259060 [Toxoplasma gondii RUB]|uniref:Uncharacterized protein n=1 Tax=Toxoplasma gondii RUB TaxID=935652 RepID=A0A086M8G9_TOXGO|nr:hypothetical protein TGRUB_259060 [Toxoplasma gondii RUB]